MQVLLNKIKLGNLAVCLLSSRVFKGQCLKCNFCSQKHYFHPSLTCHYIKHNFTRQWYKGRLTMHRTLLHFFSITISRAGIRFCNSSPLFCLIRNSTYLIPIYVEYPYFMNCNQFRFQRKFEYFPIFLYRALLSNKIISV